MKILNRAFIAGLGLALTFSYAPSVLAKKRYTQSEQSSTFASGEVRNLRKRIVNHQYNIERTLAEYKQILGAQFTSDALSLKDGERWVDVGCGKGQALYDFYHNDGTRRSGLYLTGVTFEYPDNRYKVERRYTNLFTILIGRFFENIPAEELGPTDLITDVYGAVSYTTSLDLVLNHILRVMKVGGRAYLVIPGRITLDKGYLTQFTSADDALRFYKNDTLVPPLSYFQSIQGIDHVGFVNHHVVGRETLDVLSFEKTSEAYFVPPLELVEIFDAAPPLRAFKIVNY